MVFEMPIPKDLITNAIWNSNYYKKYLEMAAHKPRQLTTMTGEEVEKKKKAPKAGKSKQPAAAKQPKPAKKKISKPTPSKKILKGKRSDHLVDEKDEESQHASKPQVEDDEYNLQRDKMAKENVPTPIRTDDQLVPGKARLPIGKSNLLMDLQKMQKNPIFHISLDILQNTNFFRAFTTSEDVPSIYI
nr:hypothetical protein [Tanacetum cinerariifolium]